MEKTTADPKKRPVAPAWCIGCLAGLVFFWLAAIALMAVACRLFPNYMEFTQRLLAQGKELPPAYKVIVGVAVLALGVVSLFLSGVVAGLTSPSIEKMLDLLRPEWRRSPSTAETTGLKCPECGTPYRLEDYDRNAAKIYCSACKTELPRKKREGDSAFKAQ